jgi:excinuclease ABC subunit C
MNQLPFDPAEPKAALMQLPRAAAVFALFGADPKDEPYIGRTPNLRARLERLLQPSAKHPRRLQLAGRVRRIEWRLTGSEFESLLTQFSLLEKIFGTKALERMHLRPPAFVRFFGSNPYPRVAVTNRPAQGDAAWTYGPFPSRAAAERYAEEVLKLFLLRRCTDDLNPDPSHPGCVYSEMKMCLAPCYKGCSDERYAEEAAAVQDFFASRGGNRLVTLRTQRDEASAALEFETAAAIHAQVEKAEAVRALASELVRPLSELRAVVLQASAIPGEVSVFLFLNGVFRGPGAFQRTENRERGNEGTEEQGLGTRDLQESVSRAEFESRLESLIAGLSNPAPSNATIRQGHLALLKRWFYRPEARRAGEIFFPNAEGRWPIRAILRGIGRVAAKSAGAAEAPS